MKNPVTHIIYIVIICFSGCTMKQQLDKDQYQELLSYRNKGLAYIEEDNLKRVLGYPSTHKQQIIDSYNIYA